MFTIPLWHTLSHRLNGRRDTACRVPTNLVHMFALLTLVLLLAVPTVHAQEVTACTPAAGEPIRIGAVFPQGTLLSVRLAEAVQGAQAMLDAINTCGGVNGRPVEWVYIPAEDREAAEAAARTLIDDEGVPLIIGSGAVAVSERLEEIANQESIVLWEVTETITANGVWAFTTRPSNRQLGSAAVEFATTALQEAVGFDDLRVALIYENRPRGQDIASGVRAALPQPPLIEQDYTNDLPNSYNLAIQIREQNVNVVMLGAFNDDADRLWYALRQADANIDAWIQIGADGYRDRLCQRYGNSDGMISISPTGPVSRDYRAAAAGEIYTKYRQRYMRANSAEPTPRADLSASGVYMLLRHVLPNVEGDFTAENIRAAIMESAIADASGLMGEGLMIDPTSGENLVPGVILQQRQNGIFCTAFPQTIATCAVPVEPFPTWRERAIREDNDVCSDSV